MVISIRILILKSRRLAQFYEKRCKSCSLCAKRLLGSSCVRNCLISLSQFGVEFITSQRLFYRTYNSTRRKRQWLIPLLLQLLLQLRRRRQLRQRSRGVKKAAAHPPVASMVNAAIKNLKDRKGSSLAAIKKYIAANYKCDVAKLAPFIRRYLKKAVADGKLKQVKGSGAAGSFRMGDKAEKKAKKPKTKKAKKAKKPKKPKTPKKPKAAKPKKTKTPKKPKAPKKSPKKAAKKPAAKKSPKKAKKPAAKKAAKK